MISRKTGSAEYNTLRSDINVTPLVDVCLVLLIVCMVITPTICKGSAVRVPETLNPRRLPTEAPRVAISLQRDGLVFIDRHLVTEERLDRAFGELAAADSAKAIVVEADHRLPYRDVRRLIERIQAAGLSKVALAAELRGR
ncbi:MAG: biopolymer transporter ExbD [Acidobacteriota bacterium]